MRHVLRVLVFLTAMAAFGQSFALAGINYIEYHERYGLDRRGYVPRKKDASKSPPGDAMKSRPAPETCPDAQGGSCGGKKRNAPAE